MAHFTHLHLHTQYSLLDGAIQHTPLFEQAKLLGMDSVAMTDHGNLFGAAEFYQKARAMDVKPIIGCEVYLAAGSRFEKEKRAEQRSAFEGINHLLLLAMNETGYRNLMYLVSKGYLDGFYYKPRIDMELLREHHEGLIATSGCLSSRVCRAITGGNVRRGWEHAEEFHQIFGDRYYLEVQRHGIADQDVVNEQLFKMAQEMKLPLLATNDCHYLHAHDHGPHDALLCVGTGTNLSDEKRFRFDGQGFYLKSPEEMLEVWHDHPEAVSNSMEIVERCTVELEMGKYHMPEFQVPAGTTREDVLAGNSWAGLRKRLGLAPDEPFEKKHAPYVKRMEHELGVINQMGFAGYFLIVADFINYGKTHGVPVGPGRGSAAGSLCTYSLGITGVDPIEYDIIFERFLNPERVSMPDIDVDFCMRGRERVIQYVREKYDGEGDDERRVAQIITFGKLQARAAIRDVGRVMGMPYGDVDRISKMVPEVLGISLANAIEQSPEMRACRDADGQVAKLLETAQALEGLTRHASTHAAGLVIGTKPLIEMVPLYRDPKTGDVVTQFDMRMVEKVGLVKFDFLGLKTLTVIADAVALVHEGPNPELDIERIDLEDSKTYDMLCAGDTAGVFQIESAGMTDLILKLAPRSFKELIPIVALYRPGPLDAGMVEDYVERKQGLKDVEYLLPELEELTSETLGVIVYQDQVLQIANKIAGYSLGRADLLRRAMGKKKPEEMAKQRSGFIEGAIANGVDAKRAGELFDLIEKFAGYGFAKSHSTAYALIMYQTAFLKANYPAQYMAALLTSEAGNHDKLARYIAASREKGMEVLPPEINSSARDFRVVPEGIRFGFAGIKNVGEGAIDSILEVREEEGPFHSIFDFTRRIDSRRVNKRVVEALVKSGAFDLLHSERARVWEAIETAMAAGAVAQRDRELGQSSLFGGETEVVSDPALPEAPPWTDQERLAFEKEALGFFVSGHPLDEFIELMHRFSNVTSVTVDGREGRDVRAAGILKSMREIRTKRGSLMAFCELEDLDGSFELVVFAEPYASYSSLLKRANERSAADPMPLVIAGKLETVDPPKILVEEVLALTDAEEKLSTQLLLRVQAKELSADRMRGMRNVLSAHPGDCEVRIHVLIPGESETILAVSEALPIRPTEELLRAVNDLFGHSVAEYTV